MIEPGEEFFAVINIGWHSRTLLGVQKAGRRIGPFTATKVTTTHVETKDRHFSFRDFEIEQKDGTDG